MPKNYSYNSVFEFFGYLESSLVAYSPYRQPHCIGPEGRCFENICKEQNQQQLIILHLTFVNKKHYQCNGTGLSLKCRNIEGRFVTLRDDWIWHSGSLCGISSY